MRKLLLILIVGAILLGAGIALSLTHLTVVNKSGMDLFIKLDMRDKPAVFYGIAVEAGNKEFPVEKLYTIVSGTYEVRASALNEDTGVFFPCYGFADDEYWDEDRALRIMTFGKGARKMIFTERNCVVQPPEVYRFWQDLREKLFKYSDKFFNYQY